MAQEKKFEDLEERITGEKISERIKILKTKTRLEGNPSFLIGYCASDDENFSKMADYIREQIGISTQGVVEIIIPPESSDLTKYIIQHKDELQQLPGEVIMIKVKGFEKIQGLESENNLRIAHDYDQNVIEGFKRHPEKIKGLTKKIVLLTQIRHSECKKAYDSALKSALGSQFKSFIYEI